MRLSEHQKNGLRLFSFAIFVFALTWGSQLIAQRFGFDVDPPIAPYPSSHIEKINQEMKVPGTIHIGSTLIQKSIEISQARSAARYEENALKNLLELYRSKQFRKAEVFGNELIDELRARMKFESGNDLKSLKTTRKKALVLLSRVYVARNKFKSAVYTLSQIKTSPIQDYVLFFKAENLESAGQHSKAVRYYDQVMALDTPLFHRARVNRARALYRAGRWSEAEPALRFVNENYIQYPRRPATVLEHTSCLEKLGRIQDAADAYQHIFFEFPFRKEGQRARKRLEELEASEATMPSFIIPARDRFLRYRKLRINKHWEIAETLFKELLADHETAHKHSSFEHEIEFQLVLIDYKQRRFDAAMQRLEKLLLEFQQGYRSGLSQYLIYKYMASIYGLRGKHTHAVPLLDRMTKGMKDATRYRVRAEYWEKHGQYEKAFLSYRRIWKTPSDQKTWHYAWLLYKTGRLKSAYRLFRERAEKASGRSRAMHLYWAARTLERAGLHQEAYGTFASVSRAYSKSYYGIQSQNRLLDLEQRTSVHGSISSKTESIDDVGEQAIEAFDHAISDWKEPVKDAIETREQPRHALWGAPQNGVLVSDNACTEAETKPSYCDAIWGGIESGERLFTPLIAPKNIILYANDSREEFATSDEDDQLDVVLGNRADAKLPSSKIRFPKHLPRNARVKYRTPARIFWKGRAKEDFKNGLKGVPGPWPETPKAYDLDTSYLGGRKRANDAIGHLFPSLERADWLAQTGHKTETREEIRFVAEEFYELRSKTRPRRIPHQLERLKWGYRIDNRRRKARQFWGILDDSLKYPVPKKGAKRNALLARQQEIYDRRQEIHGLVVDALKESGDYYFVRKLTLAAGRWRHLSPTGEGRQKWMQIYPRAFPEWVLPNAKKNKISPYLLWALMMVESSFNPDSISPANAMGLFQVIPRTGLKTAFMFDDHAFGALDLLDPEIAITQGSFYLSSLIRKFHGQELLAIPGYNGGPHRIGDWLEMRGNMPLDEFIEEIPFNEARGYAKKVFRFLVLYLRLYEGIDTLYIGQNMRQTYKADPNF